MKNTASPRPKIAHGDGPVSLRPAEINRYLYEKIYAELKEEILSGKYKKGDWFPPERVLKNRFNTTHLTVRNALAKLVLDGYIERYSGKGTVVLYSRGRPSETRRQLRFTRAHRKRIRGDECDPMAVWPPRVLVHPHRSARQPAWLAGAHREQPDLGLVLVVGCQECERATIR